MLVVWECREPLYAGAERVPWWELVPLASHGHPSVAAMARALLAGAPVVYNGDPLWDLSLTAFLDSFIQKKPKVGGLPKAVRFVMRFYGVNHN